MTIWNISLMRMSAAESSAAASTAAAAGTGKRFSRSAALWLPEESKNYVFMLVRLPLHPLQLTSWRCSASAGHVADAADADDAFRAQSPCGVDPGHHAVTTTSLLLPPLCMTQLRVCPAFLANAHGPNKACNQ